MKDLSPLAKNSMWPTSQSGGNRMCSNSEAMTAPGSSPVDPEIPSAQQSDPSVTIPAPMPSGTSGKPQASKQDSYHPARPAWGATTIPDVIRGGANGSAAT
jgi:hypothetical protein